MADSNIVDSSMTSTPKTDELHLSQPVTTLVSDPQLISALTISSSSPLPPPLPYSSTPVPFLSSSQFAIPISLGSFQHWMVSIPTVPSPVHIAVATITEAVEVRTSSRSHLSSPLASTIALLPFIPPSIFHIDSVQEDAVIKSLLVKDAMLHETNDWRSSRRGNELRRIIGDKEIKCNIVHIYVIDKPLQGLTLPLVTYNFVDENERAGKTNTTYASQTPIELSSTRKTLIRRGHDSYKEELSKGKVSSTQFPTSRTLIRLEYVPLQAQKENDVANAQKENDMANSQKDNDTTNAQKEKYGGGKLTVTRNAINPFQNDSPNNEGVKESGKSHVECSISSVQPISYLLSMLNWGSSFLVCHFLVLLNFF
ncbi:hypothetical protein Cgig2_008314 [Carnegiea gigantea]|uniref:Uncharacterized protein n=1 Tax=Carnegiea gigantea TaxID=171969 RepID=A0A9Q1GJK5_9CARY|nr:hypothetical protein Cgig2_008314 [Carnegiea gigantea]